MKRLHKNNRPGCRAEPGPGAQPLPLPEKFSEHWREKLETELRSRKYSPRTRSA